MINLPTLVRFQGQVPDRATMNREEFAIATYYYLRYINDDFVPSFEEKSDAIETQLDQFSDDMNTLKSDTETIKSDTEAIKQQTESIKNDTLTIKQQTESIKNDTQTIKDDTQTLHDETQSFRDTAGQYKDLAKNYANADQNVEVEQGYYSAKHWAMVAQNLANDTEAILPEGSINDNAVASTTTWSSQKLDSYLAKSDISNVAASAILEKVKSVDGAGSGLDADLLDGHEGSYYTNASNISSGTLSAERLPATINSNTTGNAATATKLKTARTIALSGDVSGSASFDGSGNITITTTVQNNASHNHDDRYYTKSQSDGRYLGKTAKAADSDKLDGRNSNNFVWSVNNDQYQIGVKDNRGNDTATDLGERAVLFEFKSNSTDSLNDGGGYHGVLTFQQWGDSSGGKTHQLAFTNNKNLWLRNATIGDSWTSWVKIWHAGNDGAGSGLDADLLDGMQPSTSNTATTIAQRDGSGDITARLFRTTYGAQTSAPSANVEFFFRNSSSDNYMRPLSAQAFKDWLENVLGVGGMKIKNRFEVAVNSGSNRVFDIGFVPDWSKVFVTLSGGTSAASGFMYSVAGSYYFSATYDGSHYVTVKKESTNSIRVITSSNVHGQVVLIEFT